MNKNIINHHKHVKLLLKGSMVVKYNLETIDISKGIDWTYQHKNNSKTYQVYLHSLGIIKSLVICAFNFNKPMYYKTAKNLILNWYESKYDLRITQAWNEHAVSSRIQNFIYFQQRAGREKLSENIFQKILLEHCDYLSEMNNYKENNHGIMMDNALVIASNHVTDENLRKEYLEKAYYRLKIALYRDFSKMGVHLENSPEYHKMVLKLLLQSVENLETAGLSFNKNEKGLLNRADKYIGHVIKPNGDLPLIGDTDYNNSKQIRKRYTDFVDYEAGIIISQYRDVRDLENSTWMLFKSGYHSITHKHSDDLSINLHLNKNDILVDSGKYSYNTKDSIRQFIISPKAHSTVYVKDKEYVFKNPFHDQIKLKVNKFSRKRNYKISSGINNLYDGVNISRNVVLTRDEILFVVDKITSENKEEIIQNFNLTDEAKITKVNNYKFFLEIKGKNYVLECIKINNNLIEGNIEKGYISKKFGEFIQNERIEFVAKGGTFNLITILYGKEHDEKLKIISFKNGIIEYELKGEKNYIYL